MRVVNTSLTTMCERMYRPPQLACREYIAEIARKLGIPNDGFAERVADLVVEEIEEYGRDHAMLAFTLEGAGPVCSHCGQLGGLCAHIEGNPERAKESKSELLRTANGDGS